MKFPTLKKFPFIVLCLALNALALLLWQGTTPSLYNSYNSPHYVYRLEIYNASILQRVWHYDFKAPSLVRLYRVEPKVLLGESPVVDLHMNGEIDWLLDPPVAMGRVDVGRDAIFQNIPPECTVPSHIPGCPVRP